ncbi:hypothetical protein GCM10027190_31660 [Spirosoma areae]
MQPSSGLFPAYGTAANSSDLNANLCGGSYTNGSEPINVIGGGIAYCNGFFPSTSGRGATNNSG